MDRAGGQEKRQKNTHKNSEVFRPGFRGRRKPYSERYIGTGGSIEIGVEVGFLAILFQMCAVNCYNNAHSIIPSNIRYVGRWRRPVGSGNEQVPFSQDRP